MFNPRDQSDQNKPDDQSNRPVHMCNQDIKIASFYFTTDNPSAHLQANAVPIIPCYPDTHFILHACEWLIFHRENGYKISFDLYDNLQKFYKLLRRYNTDYSREDSIFIIYFFKKLHEKRLPELQNHSQPITEIEILTKEDIYYELFYMACLFSTKFLNDHQGSFLLIEDRFNANFIDIINHNPHEYYRALAQLNDMETHCFKLLNYQLFLSVNKDDLETLPEKIDAVYRQTVNFEIEKRKGLFYHYQNLQANKSPKDEEIFDYPKKAKELETLIDNLLYTPDPKLNIAYIPTGLEL